MDVQEILECLDSLWFFSNIFSSTAPLVSFASCNGKTSQSLLKDSPRSEQPKPRTSILQKQQIQPLDSEVLVETSSISSEWDSGTEDVTLRELETHLESPKKEQRARRDERCCKSSSRRRGKYHRKQEFNHVKGCSDLSFSFREVGLGGGPVSILPELQKMEKAFEFQRLASQSHINMPPLSDSMAMKEHLKSWAYAVASIVR